MGSERLWIVVLVLVSALSGFAGGLLSAPSLGAERESGPYTDYRALLVRDFELDAQQEVWLRAVLERYHRDVEELMSHRAGEVEAELMELGLTCRDRIRKYVLPPERHAEFDRLAAGEPFPDPRAVPRRQN